MFVPWAFDHHARGDACEVGAVTVAIGGPLMFAMERAAAGDGLLAALLVADWAGGLRGLRGCLFAGLPGLARWGSPNPSLSYATPLALGECGASVLLGAGQGGSGDGIVHACGMRR